MDQTSLATHRGDYGYDAVYALLAFTALATLSLVTAVWSARTNHPGAMGPALIYFAFFGLNAASYCYATRRGKFLEWARLIGAMEWRGDERVLDLGCGRGAVLTMVARRLPRGTVTGIDLWTTFDQSGLSERACRENAEREGVSDRVVLQTGDMRSLPFPDASFDVVVSSLAIHNITAASGRASAIAEAVRVLVPGGRLVIADIRRTGAYARELARLGMLDVTRRRLGWRFWYGNPIAATSLVTARKPAA
jgi:SAM-dependent methyltransferase